MSISISLMTSHSVSLMKCDWPLAQLNLWLKASHLIGCEVQEVFQRLPAGGRRESGGSYQRVRAARCCSACWESRSRTGLRTDAPTSSCCQTGRLGRQDVTSQRGQSETGSDRRKQEVMRSPAPMPPTSGSSPTEPRSSDT